MSASQRGEEWIDQPNDDPRRGRRDPPSFVITLWLEPGEEQTDPEWRWRAVEVQSGRKRYFRRLRDLLAYISERAGVPPPQ